MAMASLLASPISWTHHRIWVLLIPALMPRHRTAGIPRPVRIMLWGLLALTVAAPYWWFSHGILADAAEAVLPAWTAAVLLVWSVLAAHLVNRAGTDASLSPSAATTGGFRR